MNLDKPVLAQVGVVIFLIFGIGVLEWIHQTYYHFWDVYFYRKNTKLAQHQARRMKGKML